MIYSYDICCCFFYRYGYPQDLPELTHSFPTRRSSDLLSDPVGGVHCISLRLSEGRQRRQVRHGARVRAEQHQPDVGNRLVREAELQNSPDQRRSEEHTSELQSLMHPSYDVFCLKKTYKPT